MYRIPFCAVPLASLPRPRTLRLFPDDRETIREDMSPYRGPHPDSRELALAARAADAAEREVTNTEPPRQTTLRDNTKPGLIDTTTRPRPVRPPDPKPRTYRSSVPSYRSTSSYRRSRDDDDYFRSSPSLDFGSSSSFDFGSSSSDSFSGGGGDFGGGGADSNW